MPDEQRPGSVDRELVTKIVGAYLGHNPLGADQIGTLISTVHQALGHLGEPTEAAVERPPAVPVRRSVHRDYVVCLECGYRGRMLKRHLIPACIDVDR